MDDAPIVTAIDPDEAFATLANETRIEILQALWEAEGHQASFTDLYNAVSVDDSGQLNYHLSQITGRFVTKTDEGYELRNAGQHVVGSLLSGGYTMEGDIETIEMDDECPNCDEPREFDYVDEEVVIRCRECGVMSNVPVPPGVFVGYSREQFPSVAQRYVRTLIDHARRGFCPTCNGKVQPEIRTYGEIDVDVPAEVADSVTVQFRCERCKLHHQIDPTAVLLTTSGVVTFFYDRGLDVTDLSLWRLPSYVDESTPEIVGRDPTRLRVTYVAGDDRFSITIGESLDVVETDVLTDHQ